jgi:anti-anti-sigma regulatory factor
MAEETTSYVLPERLDVQSAKALKAGLAAGMGHAIQIDASNVEWVGGLGAQILAATRSHWRATDQVFSIENASEAFVEGLRRLGFSPELDPIEEC